MAIDPNEIAAWINNVANKSYLLQLRQVIDTRLVALGFPPALLVGVGENELAIAAGIRPVPVVDRLIKKAPEGRKLPHQGANTPAARPEAGKMTDRPTESLLEASGAVPEREAIGDGTFSEADA